MLQVWLHNHECPYEWGKVPDSSRLSVRCADADRRCLKTHRQLSRQHCLVSRLKSHTLLTHLRSAGKSWPQCVLTDSHGEERKNPQEKKLLVIGIHARSGRAEANALLVRPQTTREASSLRDFADTGSTSNGLQTWLPNKTKQENYPRKNTGFSPKHYRSEMCCLDCAFKVSFLQGSSNTWILKTEKKEWGLITQMIFCSKNHKH